MPDLSPLWISLKTAGLATVITGFLGLVAAHGMLGYRGRWKAPMEGLFIAPLVLPPTVVGFLLLLLLGRHGPLGQLLAFLHINLVFTWYANLITAVVVAFPLMYKTTLGAFEQVDRHLIQVAQTLGASRQRIFWQILLPLSLPGILAGTTLAFARALGEFGATLMLAGNIPGKTQTLPMAIYFAVQGGAMTEAWLWVGVMIVLSLSGLMGVNLWRHHYETTLQHSVGEMVEALDFGLGQEASTTSVTPPTPLPRVPPSGLWVDIQKHLHTFTLDTRFSAVSETLGILGGSGSGKSMTLRCIAGIETPSQGRIVLNGQTLFDAERRINIPSHRRKVSLVFQNYALFPHLTVVENIGFGLQHLPRLDRSLRITQHLDRLELQGLGDRYPHQLSGGQQQRVALARALATEPDVLLLDEPFSALDTYLRSHLEQQLVETLRTYPGITLFVTHNLEEAYRVCQRLMVMSGGKPIALDEHHRIFEHPGTLRVAQLTGCKNFSPVTVVNARTIVAHTWGITLQITPPLPQTISHVGIRAHQLRLTPTPDPTSPNSFPAWLTRSSETPHRMTLYLKLQSPPNHPQDYHLQGELFKDQWYTLQNQPYPWGVQLLPDRLLPLQH